MSDAFFKPKYRPISMETCITTNHLIKQKYYSGFTLVELIVVILIVGILSASIAPRFFGVASYESRKATDDVFSALRYAQQMAMNRGGDIQLVLTASNFTVLRSGGGDLRSPDGLIPYTKPFPAGVTVVPSPSDPQTINFNALGQPESALGVLNTTNTTLNIGTNTITVEANTGYAH